MDTQRPACVCLQLCVHPCIFGQRSVRLFVWQ